MKMEIVCDSRRRVKCWWVGEDMLYQVERYFIYGWKVPIFLCGVVVHAYYYYYWFKVNGGESGFDQIFYKNVGTDL